jgi:hypothetical protein
LRLSSSQRRMPIRPCSSFRRSPPLGVRP